MVIDFGHIKAIGKTVKTAKGVDTKFHLKGNPQNLANKMVKMHGKEKAIQIVKGMPQDSFWTQVSRFLGV